MINGKIAAAGAPDHRLATQTIHHASAVCGRMLAAISAERTGAPPREAERQKQRKPALDRPEKHRVAGLVALFVDQLVLADPRHHRAQLGADFFDRMLSAAFAHGLE